MLEVTKILEGGVDLATGDELPRCIVVSNRHNEVSITVKSEDLKKILALFIDGRNRGEVGAAPMELFSHEPRESEVAMNPNPGPVMRVVEDAPPSTDMSDEEFDAGEDYNDSGTGVGSL
jgi:hypothetical protein